MRRSPPPEICSRSWRAIAHEYFGLRLNAYVSIVGFILSTGFFIWWQFIRRETPSDRPRAKRVVPEGPAMAVPKGRVRSGR